MTTITLPPDLQDWLSDEALRRGTTPELLAIDGLRQLFASPATENGVDNRGTLFDFLDGYIGTIAGETEAYSEDCGQRFAEGLEDKQIRGSL